VRITLDTERCQGHGRCYTLAPDIFDADDYGHAVLLLEEVPAGREHDARSAVENCPEQALAIED